MIDEQRIIYVVTSGDYDAYMIRAVCSTLDGARAFVAYKEAHATPVEKLSTFSIEEWPLDPTPEGA